MILLEYESAILRNLLERSLDPNDKLSGKYQFCDFDGVEFQLNIDKEKIIKIQLKLPGAKEIMENGGEDYYNRVYAEYKTEPTAPYTHAIQFKLEGMEAPKQKEVITLAACLRANLMAAPFLYIAEQFCNKTTFAPFEIPYRPTTQESIYITPSENGAVATFSIRFSDPGDRIIGGVFFQELKAARVKVNSAPGINFGFEVPQDLQTFDLPRSYTETKDYGFVSIVLGNPQLNERKRQQTGYIVPMFRDYIHYHIKCTKAFMHQRMRARTALLLRELDAAKPAPKKVIKRTATGKIINTH